MEHLPHAKQCRGPGDTRVNKTKILLLAELYAGEGRQSTDKYVKKFKNIRRS